jgi:hypothetical protein
MVSRAGAFDLIPKLVGKEIEEEPYSVHGGEILATPSSAMDGGARRGGTADGGGFLLHQIITEGRRGGEAPLHLVTEERTRYGMLRR